MPASAPAPTEPNSSPITEGEALCYLLGEMGVTLGVDLANERLFAEVSGDTPTGALDVLKIITKRFDLDAEFREEVINAISHSGHYLAEAPSFEADLKIAEAPTLIVALSRSGLLVSADIATVHLSFSPMPDRRIAPNAHILMDLMTRRCLDEPGFLRSASNYVFAINNAPNS